MSDFNRALKEAGIPQTAQEMQAEWQKVAAEENTDISNNSAYSAFWRLITAMVTTPALWLVNFLRDFVLKQMFVQTATGQWLDFHAGQHNVIRKAATKARGKISFYRAVNHNNEIVIPANTRIISSTPDGQTLMMKTLSQKSLLASVDVVAIDCEAADSGSTFNVNAGYFSQLVDPIRGVRSVRNEADWLTLPGADAESDSSLRLRIRDQFGGLSDHHVDSVYRSILSRIAGVNASNLRFEHDAPRGPGTANIFYWADVGQPAEEFIEQLNSLLREGGNHGHGDDVKVFAMPNTEHDIAAAIWPIPNLTLDQRQQLLQDVTRAIQAAFRENSAFPAITRTQPFSRFSSSQFVRELHRTLPNLAEIEISGTNIRSEMSIPRIKQLSVTWAND